MGIVSFIERLWERMQAQSVAVPTLVPLRKLSMALVSRVPEDVLGALDRLGHSEIPRHVPRLLHVLDHPNERCVRGAIDLLMHWQVLEALPHIDRALKRLDRQLLQGFVHGRCTRVDPGAEVEVAHRVASPVPLLDWRENKTIASRRRDNGGSKPPTLAGVTDLPKRVSARRLGRWLRDTDAAIRVNACQCVLRQQRRQAWRLIPLLADRDRSVRQAARGVFTQLGLGELKAVLLRAFVTHPERAGQRLLLRWAARPENQRSMLLLGELVARVSRVVRARLIRFLLRHPVPELADQLAEWSIAASERLLDQCPETIDEGQAFIAEQSDVQKLETLAGVMELRRPDCFSLARLNTALVSPDPRIRACAVLVMSEYVDFPRALPVLLVLVLDRAEGVRDAVMTTLESGRCCDRELLRILRSDPCPDIRRRANQLLDEVA